MRRLACTLLIIAAATAAQAQPPCRAPAGPVPPPPTGAAPSEAVIWPFPPPDPNAWWTDPRPAPPEAADPLGGRRLPRDERIAPVDNGVDGSTYRLWGLMPLDRQRLFGGEMILEVWVRPARSVRQSVVRITVRHDGKAFVQGRAGLACCEAGIARRMGFDAELPEGRAQAFLALRGHPMWTQPRDVELSEGGGLTYGGCVDGTSYDLTLVVPGRARSLRRACDPEAVGQAADAIAPALAAALGYDARFDVIFRGGVDFDAERRAYQALIARGGGLKAATGARPRPPALAPVTPPQPEPALAPSAPSPCAAR